MKPGQVLTDWFSQLAGGRLTTPQSIYRASLRDLAKQDSKFGARFLSIPEENSVHFDIPQRLAYPSAFVSSGWLRQSERADWQHCDPRLMRWAAMVVNYATKHNIPLYIHTAFRGASEQERVKAAGNSRASAGKSPHGIGEAVDIVHSVFHWDLSKTEWLFLHNLGRLALQRMNATLPKERQIALTWGGDFKSLYDPAHWEFSDFRQRLRPISEGVPIHKTPAAILRDIRF